MLNFFYRIVLIYFLITLSGACLTFAYECKPAPNEVFKEPVEENVSPGEKAPLDKKDVYSWQAKEYKYLNCAFPGVLEHLGQPKGNPSPKEDVLSWQKQKLYKEPREVLNEAFKRK